MTGIKKKILPCFKKCDEVNKNYVLYYIHIIIIIFKKAHIFRAGVNPVKAEAPRPPGRTPAEFNGTKLLWADNFADAVGQSSF